jgi:hypothetical protein
MDEIIKRGHTEKLHLWDGGEQLGEAEFFRWIDQ